MATLLHRLSRFQTTNRGQFITDGKLYILDIQGHYHKERDKVEGIIDSMMAVVKRQGYAFEYLARGIVLYSKAEEYKVVAGKGLVAVVNNQEQKDDEDEECEIELEDDLPWEGCQQVGLLRPDNGVVLVGDPEVFLHDENVEALLKYTLQVPCAKGKYICEYAFNGFVIKKRESTNL